MGDIDARIRAAMAEADEWGTVADFERSLAEQGLHIVTAGEKAVLDEMAGIEIEVLEHIRNGHSAAPLIFHPPCLAELARREAKP